jgi:hypothetical protein
MVRQRRQSVAHLPVVLLATAVGACSAFPGAGPEVDLAASPRYPCEGDAVALTFRSDGVEQFDVRDAQGRIVGQARGPSGVVTIAHITRAMLPLTASVRSVAGARDARIPGAVPLGVIAAATLTEVFPLDTDVTSPEARTQIGTQDCGCTLDDDGAPLECQRAAPVYDVTLARAGGAAQFDSALFSPRAHVVGLINGTPYDLTYYHGDNRIATVPHGQTQEIDFASEISPAGTWSGRFTASSAPRRYAGTFVDGGPVCTGWVHRPAPRPATTGDPPVTLGFRLRCME